ncbi:MAG: hypothetical protein ACI9HY_002932 [Planctomycetaceae bacterium]|jgi:hypothetical protein
MSTAVTFMGNEAFVEALKDARDGTLRKKKRRR